MTRAIDGSVSVLILRALVMGGLSRGLDAKALAEGACIPLEVLLPQTLGDPDGRVPARYVVRLWELLPRALGDDCFGLTLAALAAGAPLSVGWWLVWSSPTLGQGLAQGIRYQRLLHDQAQSELLLDEREGTYRHQVGALPDRAPRHAIEFGFASFARFARRATGKEVLPSRVAFQHPAPRDLGQHRATFGPNVRFEQPADELAFDRASLDLPLLTADESLQEVLASHARSVLRELPGEQAQGLHARLRHVVCQELKSGELSLERVARRLGVAPRSLQRRLKSEGATFAQSVDALRRELAESYLRDRRLSIQESAFLLGFSDVRTFHRAFVRWTGMSPGRFQAQPTSQLGAPGRAK